MSKTKAFLLVIVLMWIMQSRVPGNVLLNPQYTVDDLIIIEGADTLLRGGEAVNIRATSANSGIELQDKVLSGSLVLAPVKARFAFNEGIPSWNGWAPQSAGGFEVLMRAELTGIPSSLQSKWTPWFGVGDWGMPADVSTSRTVTFSGGKYDLDTLLLDRPARQVQFRVDLFRVNIRAPSPALRLLAFSYTNSLGDKTLWQEFGDKRKAIPTALNQLQTTETLVIPYCSQVVPNRAWTGRICQTASVCMALKYFDINRATEEIAVQVYDPVVDMFGIWHRSIQAAAQESLRGYIGRFRSWDSVRQAVKRGEVLCASIRFSETELRDPPPPYRTHGTGGHIIVIEGFAPGGKIVTNDSSSRRYGHNELWLQEDLAKAWFDKGGVAFVFTGRAFHSP